MQSPYGPPPQPNPYPQEYPPQQPYGHPPQQAPYGMQPGYGYPMAPQGPRRNVVLIALGSIALFIGLLAVLVFVYNAYQYATVDFSDIPHSEWLEEMVQEAAMRRMTVFGSVALLFGVGGLVMGGLGLRKR